MCRRAEQAAARIAPLWPLQQFRRRKSFPRPRRPELRGCRQDDGARGGRPDDHAARLLSGCHHHRADHESGPYRRSGRIAEHRRVAPRRRSADRSGGPEWATAVRVLPTVAGIASELTGKEWSGFVTDRAVGLRGGSLRRGAGVLGVAVAGRRSLCRVAAGGADRPDAGDHGPAGVPARGRASARRGGCHAGRGHGPARPQPPRHSTAISIGS